MTAARRPVGGGTKVGWAPAPDADLVPVPPGEIREHNAGDLTAVVDAGVPLAELQRSVAEAGQMLALDPPLGAGERATVGGVVAANDSGPLRHRYGSARDLVVGITVALADGTVAKAGGKVIKNVAGYDLAKLFTGSFGSLGTIVDLSVRLHPLPPATATAIGRSADPRALAEAAATLSHRPLELHGLDVRWDGGDGALLARLGRREPRAAAAIAGEMMREHGLDTEVLEDDQREWETQREWQRSDHGAIVRVSGLQTQLLDVLSVAARVGGRVTGRAGLGLSWVEVTGAAEVDELRQALAPSPCVVLDCPPEIEVDRTAPADAGARELMRRVKERFDPDGACAPALS